MEGATSPCWTREIVEIRENIRQKYNALKRMKAENDEYNKVKYKPIVNAIKETNIALPIQLKREVEDDDHMPKRLKQLYIPTRAKPFSIPSVLDVFTCPSQDKDVTLSCKKEQYADVSKDVSEANVFDEFTRHAKDDDYTESRNRRENTDVDEDQPQCSSMRLHLPEPDVFEFTPSRPLLEQVGEEVKTPEGIQMAFDFMEKFGETPSKYIMKFLNNDLQGLDQTYGVHYDGTKFTIGDSIVTMGDNELEIGGERYIATPGLMELIFMKNPNLQIVVENDKKQYKQILQHTNAHRKRYSTSGEINVIKSHPKWPVISSLFKAPSKKEKTNPPSKQQKTETKRGFGVVDINNMIERLKFLLTSRDRNRRKTEIAFIEQKLRDARIIL